MRLINTQTLQLEDVWSAEDIEYAILSHRWEDSEVSLQDMQSTEAQRKAGFAKIQLSCRQAAHDGYKYVWIDTCCIDKTSSAELTEAINSMYQWYRDSAVCYVYLSDVQYDAPQSLPESAWFTRGWTLQELIAPQNVIFFDTNWVSLGTKQTLYTTIVQVTGIDAAILNGESIFERSIAQRMSWAANRVTTRIEDVSYSLLGLFDINMPMLYGEGQKAFLRLQEEIVRQSDDHSIFAWPKTSEDEPGLLAQSPAAFATCGRVKATPSRKGRSAYSMTNRGLEIKLDATPWCPDTYLVALHCIDESLETSDIPIESCQMGMFLRQLDEDDQFIRVKHAGKTFVQIKRSVWEGKNSTSRRPVRPAAQINIRVRQKVLKTPGTVSKIE